jgi:ribosomal protein S18 acetylase RimI-like enzyme
MLLIESACEVAETISRAKADAPAYCSNFFPAPRKIQDWITHGELFYEQSDGAALLLRKDRDFWHLYFCAASPTSLQQAVTAFPMLGTEPVVVDLVGQEPACADLAGLFEAAGFRLYNRLFRMARIVSSTTPPAAAPDPRVVLAAQADCQSILDLLLQSFDRRAEQIPMLYEIEAAVGAGQIWVARNEGALAGLLFFETQGLTSTLRYWLIAPEFRTQRFGSGLMRRYFVEHPAVRRFLLWVIAGNTNTIAKYEHYGFAPDGLIDKVLANEMIRP